MAMAGLVAVAGLCKRKQLRVAVAVADVISSVISAILSLSLAIYNNLVLSQGGRTWQPFVGSKNVNENFRQARFYNFRVKCVFFARNHKFAKLTQ